MFTLLLTAALTAPPAADAYPRPERLIEPAALAAATDFVVLDVRTEKAYAAGHVPGARRIDPDDWAKGFGDGTDLAGWTKRIGGVGITAKSTVVLYDDSRSKDAARAWWMLRYFGVADARVLNGGWKAWTAGKYPVSTEAVTPGLDFFTPKPQTKLAATKELILESLPGQSLQIVDCRSQAERLGTEAMGNKRTGTIPGAKHLEWSELLDAETHRFLPPAELKKKLAAAGIALDRPTVSHCQGGSRSAVMTFVLDLMGADEARNYHPSFGEWAKDAATPIVPPAPKK